MAALPVSGHDASLRPLTSHPFRWAAISVTPKSLTGTLRELRRNALQEADGLALHAVLVIVGRVVRGNRRRCDRKALKDGMHAVFESCSGVSRLRGAN